MDRRTFIRNSSFSVLALGLSSISGFADAAPHSLALSIEQNHHIRHGLLQQLNQEAFKHHAVLFHRNHFYQGITEQGASEQLQVWSILSKPLKAVRSIQLSTSASKIEVVGPHESVQLNREYESWQLLYQDAYQRIELFSGMYSREIVKPNPEGNEQFFLSLSGNVQSNFGTISPEKGQKHSEQETTLQMLQNNCSVLCVSQLRK